MATRTTTNMVVWMIALHPDTATVASPSSGATRNRTDLPTIDKCNYCKQRWRIVEVTVLAVKELLTVSMLPESKILFLYYHIVTKRKNRWYQTANQNNNPTGFKVVGAFMVSVISAIVDAFEAVFKRSIFVSVYDSRRLYCSSVCTSSSN